MKFSEEKAREIGDALSVDWGKIDINEFVTGLEVECEHKDVTGGDLMLTGKIALAHLKEVPDYYTKLRAHVELDKAVVLYELKKEWEIIKEKPHKEPHEMTVQEFHDSRQRGPFKLDWMEAHFAHMGAVRDAYKAGKTIHPDNFKEYPDLAKAVEPWQRTKKDYMDYDFVGGVLGARNDKMCKDVREHDHRIHVKRALAEGKKVPSEVLVDYPDLVKGKLQAKPGYKLVQTVLVEGGKSYNQHRWIPEAEPVPEGYTVLENPENIDWQSSNTKWFGNEPGAGK
jgi:hypothetical protein